MKMLQNFCNHLNVNNKAFTKQTNDFQPFQRSQNPDEAILNQQEFVISDMQNLRTALGNKLINTPGQGYFVNNFINHFEKNLHNPGMKKIIQDIAADRFNISPLNSSDVATKLRRNYFMQATDVSTSLKALSGAFPRETTLFTQNKIAVNVNSKRNIMLKTNSYKANESLAEQLSHYNLVKESSTSEKYNMNNKGEVDPNKHIILTGRALKERRTAMSELTAKGTDTSANIRARILCALDIPAVKLGEKFCVHHLSGHDLWRMNVAFRQEELFEFPHTYPRNMVEAVTKSETQYQGGFCNPEEALKQILLIKESTYPSIRVAGSSANIGSNEVKEYLNAASKTPLQQLDKIAELANMDGVELYPILQSSFPSLPEIENGQEKIKICAFVLHNIIVGSHLFMDNNGKTARGIMYGFLKRNDVEYDVYFKDDKQYLAYCHKLNANLADPNGLQFFKQAFTPLSDDENIKTKVLGSPDFQAELANISESVETWFNSHELTQIFEETIGIPPKKSAIDK